MQRLGYSHAIGLLCFVSDKCGFFELEMELFGLNLTLLNSVACLGCVSSPI